MSPEEVIKEEPLPESAGDPTVTFSLNLPGAASSATRGMSANDESDVQTVDVLLFNNDGSNNRLYYGRVVGGALNNAPGGNKTFTARIPVGEHNNFDITIVANGRQSVAAAGLVPGEAKLAALKKLTLQTQPDQKWTATIPMWGEAQNITVNAATNLSGANAVKMTRMVARIDVLLSKQAASGSANPADPWNNNNFKLHSVRLYNYNTSGTLAPDLAAGWDAVQIKATAPHQPAGGWGQRVYNNSTVMPLEYGAADQHAQAQFLPDSLVRALYTLEAPRGSATTLSTNTCLVVGGFFQNDTAETFYRVDFSARNPITQQWDYLDLLRNHKYIVNINKISGAGFDTPDEAFNSQPVNIDVGILQWNEADMGNVIFDGEHYLAVNPGEFELDKLAGSAAFTARTNLKSWKLRVCDVSGNPLTDKWLKIDGTETVNVTATPDVDKQFSIDYTENTTGAVRVAYVFVEAGKLQYRVKVTQSDKIELRIKITDENDELIPNNMLEFNPAGGHTSKFKVTWSPADRPVTITKVQTGAEPFTWQHADNALTTLPGQTTPRATKTFTVDPVALSGVFNSRGSTMTFTITSSDGLETASASVDLYQANKFRSMNTFLSPVAPLTYTFEGGTKDVFVESFASNIVMEDGTTHTTDMPVPWRATFSHDGGTTWSATPPAWLTNFPVQSAGSLSGETLNIAASPAPITSQSTEQNVTEDLKATPMPTGAGSSQANAIDLTRGTGKSANSYVVNGPGWYEFPLYYGNARNNPGAISSAGNYVDPLGSVITTAPISGVANATLVWQDSPGLISNIQTDGTWVSFCVDAATIAQGNASVAVRNANGDVLWSWHIWVTSPTIWDAENPQTIAVTNIPFAQPAVTQQTNNFSINNLGYKTKNTTVYTGHPTVTIKISQLIGTGAKESIFTATQSDYSTYMPAYTSYYQFGRPTALPRPGVAIEWGVGFGNGQYVFSLPATTIFASVSRPDGAVPNGTVKPANMWNANNLQYDAVGVITARTGADVGKSVYDPNPIGFKMPPPGAFMGIIKSSTPLSDLYISASNVGTNVNASLPDILNVADFSNASDDNGFKLYSQPDGGGSIIFLPFTGSVQYPYTTYTGARYFFSENNSGTSGFCLNFSTSQAYVIQTDSTPAARSIRPIAE